MATQVHDFDPVAVFTDIGVAPRRITSDSRSVDRGAAFAAYPGALADGRRFIPDAVGRGAAAVLWERRGYAWPAGLDVPQHGVEGLHDKLGAIANAVYGFPSRDLWMVGVTGTNGKTSCTHWIAQAAEACGRAAAIVGTLGVGRIGALAAATNTTPDVCVVHESLAQFRRAGVALVAMEVSSHGLDQGRVNGVEFDVALFTNLTRDHLDYHGTMAAYGQAKAKLFAWPALATAVINADDPFGQGLIDAARARGQRVLTYGLAGADIVATHVAATNGGLALTVATPFGRGEVRTRIVGAFNAYNLLGVLGVLLASDVPLRVALGALAALTPPPGRMQCLGGGLAPLVVVDYAHSPDALEKALTALRPAVADARELVCVFGCGGDRDKGKRAEMGRIAASLADRVVVTSDNPRSEAPADIAAAIVHGIRQSGARRYLVELDRAAAIGDAIAAAASGDVVLVAGKGHETYQDAGGVRSPFCDATEAAAALAGRSGA
ncbi:MAG: UDP-N-acetylmuramoyl-L-alanyl-D-glutamate--2,6-diaminopimelate ligase, partial [Betaproteobacteria bacterium]